MKLTYIGPHDSVTVPLPSGAAPEAVRGGDIDVPDEIGKSLLEQTTNWTPAKSGKEA